MSVSVSVKTPTAAPAPPSAPSLETKDLSPEEKLLLEGTQKANVTMMLEALQAGANPNVRDPKGRTPLHFMAGVGLAPAAALLIHFGAQVDARDFDDLTPLHMAAGYANSQTLRVLVVAGADTTLKGKAQGTPFEVVCSLGDYQLKQVYDERSKPQNRFKKKDEKLEELKKCLDVLDDPEALRAEESWDELMQDVLRAIASNDAEVVQEAAA